VGVIGHVVYQRTSSGDVSVATPGTSSAFIGGRSASMSYIWNMDSLNVKGTDLTNKWASSSRLPAKINGSYYVVYYSRAAIPGVTSRPSDGRGPLK
jgi:hypothetical protein